MNVEESVILMIILHFKSLFLVTGCGGGEHVTVMGNCHNAVFIEDDRWRSCGSVGSLRCQRG